MKFRQVHLDFHTSEKLENIGADFNKEELEKAIVQYNRRERRFGGVKG